MEKELLRAGFRHVRNGTRHSIWEDIHGKRIVLSHGSRTSWRTVRSFKKEIRNALTKTQTSAEV